MAKNQVIGGDYKTGIMMSFGFKLIISFYLKRIELNKDTIEEYELITEDTRKSLSSGIARGAAGHILLGGIGSLAGGLSAKNKTKRVVAIKFKDGKNSLVELDEKMYLKFIKATLK